MQNEELRVQKLSRGPSARSRVILHSDFRLFTCSDFSVFLLCPLWVE